MDDDFQRLLEVSWRSPPLATFETIAAVIDARFGAPSLRDLDSNGIGDFDAHLLQFRCGLEVALWRFHLAAGGLRPVDPKSEPSIYEIHANEPDLEHVAHHIHIAFERMSPWLDYSSGRPLAPPRPHRFRAMRLDDNGNEFLVKAVSSRCEADELVREYEARGHKQTYWIEELKDGS
jgi:hypothetical protein